MKRWLLMLMALVLSVGFSSQALANDSSDMVPDDVMTAATEALELYKEYVMDRPKEYGFEEPEEANDLTLGKGHPVYRLNMGKLMQEENADSLLALSDLEEEWEFVVLYAGEPRSFLSVGRNDSGGWEALGFGGTSYSFAQGISLFEEWTAEQRTEEQPYIIRHDSNRYIVADLQGVEHALSVDSGNTEEESVPDRTELLPSSEVIAELQEGRGNRLVPLLLVVLGVLILAASLRVAMRKPKIQPSAQRRTADTAKTADAKVGNQAAANKNAAASKGKRKKKSRK